MGRLEKQIIAGALALVGILLVVVVYRGLDHNPLQEESAGSPTPSVWQDPDDGLRVRTVDANPAAAGQTPPASSPTAPAADEGSSLPLTIRPASDPTASEAQPAVAPPAEAEAAPAVAEKPSMPVVRNLGPDEDWDVGIRTYVVRDGNTIGHIAQRELGSTRYVDDILKLNEGLDPKRLHKGQKISLPTHVRRAAAPSEIPAGTRSHTVAAGDTLWTIADRYYGDGSRYTRILSANPGMDQNSVLKIGSRIAVPE